MSFFVYKNLMNGKKDQYQKEKNYHHLNTKKLTNSHFYIPQTLIFWCFLLNFNMILCKY